MENRIIVDAVTPTPHSFTAATKATGEPEPEATPAPSLEVLKDSIRVHFPKQVREHHTLPPTHRLHSISSLPDLQRAILHARSTRARVRASTGGLKSARNRVHLRAGGYVLDTTPLKKLVYFRSRGVMVAQAGVTLQQVGDVARAHGLSLRVNSGAGGDARSIGAAFVTGVLGGGGMNEGVFGDVVEEVSMVDSYGRLRVFSTNVHPDVFPALRVSLGFFGVVYDMTMRVNDFPRYVSVSHSFIRVGSMLARKGRALRNFATAQSGVEFIWFPYNSCKSGARWDAQEDLVWLRAQSELTSGEEACKEVCTKGLPPWLRILTLPQWLHVNACTLVSEGYTRFAAADAQVFVADAFRQSGWVLAKKRRTCSVAHAVDYEYFDGTASTQAVTIAIPVRVGSAGGSARGTAADANEESDGWMTVHKALKLASSALQRASDAGEYAMVATTRVSVRVVQSSDAVLSGNASLGACNMHAAVVRIQGVRNAKGWTEFARGLVTEWVRMRRVRWFWHRDGVGVLTRDVVMCLEGVDECVEAFVQAREEADVDDYGMFLDEGLDELAGGAFSKRFSRVDEVDEGEGCGERSVWRRWQELDAFGKVGDGKVGDGNGEEVGDGGRKAKHEGRKTERAMISRSERMWSKVSVWLYFIVVLVVLVRAAIERVTAN